MSLARDPDAPDGFPEGSKVARVNVDVDGYRHGWRLHAIRVYHNLFAAGAHTVEVTISSSGIGLHLTGWFDFVPREEAKLRLRESLGDDPKRVSMDRERGRRGHVTQVTWSDKGIREGTADDDFADVYDALDHINATQRSDYQRAHDLANDGHRACTEYRGLNRTP